MVAKRGAQGLAAGRSARRVRSPRRPAGRCGRRSTWSGRSCRGRRRARADAAAADRGRCCRRDQGSAALPLADLVGDLADRPISTTAAVGLAGLSSKISVSGPAATAGLGGRADGGGVAGRRDTARRECRAPASPGATARRHRNRWAGCAAPLSPGRRKASSMVEIAAMPLQKPALSSAPSSAARRASTMVRLGWPRRA